LDWPSAIGTFLIQFGVLDYLLVVYLKDNLELTEFVRLRERHFKDRLSRVAQHLRDSGCPTGRQEEFEHLLTRLDPIRELRNHIAHGHILLRGNVETEMPEISLSLPKDMDQEYSPESRHLTFDELRASLNELTEVIEAFKGIVGFRDVRNSE
jgi:hypothetical protein